MHEKGQLSAYDLLFAVVLFMLAFVVLNSIWMESYANAIKKEETSRMHFSARQALRVLVESPGEPDNWDSAGVEVPGLLKNWGSEKISREKVSELEGMDYNNVKQLLALEEFEFLLSIDAVDDSLDTNIGIAAPPTAKAVRLKRTKYYEGGEASIEFSVFE